MQQETEGKLRARSSHYLHLLEAALYIAVGVLLSAAAIAVLFEAAGILWRGIANRTLVNYGLQVLDQLLFVLVLVEILHTVQISERIKVNAPAGDCTLRHIGLSSSVQLPRNCDAANFLNAIQRRCPVSVISGNDDGYQFATPAARVIPGQRRPER